MNRTARTTCIVLLFFVAPLFMFNGCSRKPEPPAGELLGKVFSNDVLVGDCQVAIYNPTSMLSLGARVDGQGEFTIPKIPLGEYVVTFAQMSSNSAKNPPFDKRIPQKYRDRKTTDLKVEIKEGENPHDFKMTR